MDACRKVCFTSRIFFVHENVPTHFVYIMCCQNCKVFVEYLVSGICEIFGIRYLWNICLTSTNDVQNLMLCAVIQYHNNYGKIDKVLQSGEIKNDIHQSSYTR